MIKIYEINENNTNLLDKLNKKNSNATVLVFHDECHHCKMMKPEWDKMKQKLHNKPANIFELNGRTLPLIDHPIKNVVDGFPTIMNINNQKITPFQQDRSANNFIKFVESNILKMKPRANKSMTKFKVKFNTRKRKINHSKNNNNTRHNKIKKVRFNNNFEPIQANHNPINVKNILNTLELEEIDLNSIINENLINPKKRKQSKGKGKGKGRGKAKGKGTKKKGKKSKQ
tara:strand:- start:20318 stop:21004 length:687 start_codon:yes stop_codon:yes gene_type:complete